VDAPDRLGVDGCAPVGQFVAVDATRRGSSRSSSVGIPCATPQYLQARVQTSPRIMNVAVPASQHSPMFGQPASSHTVCSEPERIMCFSRR
jgi:hypothetical protein